MLPVFGHQNIHGNVIFSSLNVLHWPALLGIKDGKFEVKKKKSYNCSDTLGVYDD